MVLTIWWMMLYLLLMGLSGGYIAWLVLGKSKALSSNRKPNWSVLFIMGLAGSFVGGLAVSLLAGDGLTLRPSGMVASAAGAVVIAAVYVRMQGGKK